MNRPTRSALVLAACAMNSISAVAQSSPLPADRFLGTWFGVLSTPAGRLRISLMVARDASGAITGSMTSLDQGNAKIPSTFSLHTDTLVVAMPAANASYAAVVVGDSLLGAFTQGIAMPLRMGRGASAPGTEHPQEPKGPFPYASEDVTFESVHGVRLAGTITMPPGAGPFPAVVMVTGSGAQDRNEELVGHKPFLVIADYLARHGIATLRYDDRGFARSTGHFVGSTSADFANDAEAAVRFLRGRPGIAGSAVGIIGHSEGGMIAPMVAARSKDVAFIVLLAGPGLPGDSILLLQGALIAKASGVPQAMIDQNVYVNRRMFDVLKTTPDSAEAAAKLSALSARMVETLPVAQRGEAASQLASSEKQSLDPWMRYFVTYDPRPALRKTHVPVLALDGSLDLQVPPEADLAAIDAALKEAGNHDFKTVELPKLNHLFQTATTGAPNEYATISETFSPAALDLIATWISSHTAGKK
jgi:pimeloyl-ACP methyl ester carboxylesterase